MEPAIGRSIAVGFSAAKRGWLGILVYAGGLLVLWGLLWGIVTMTGMPPELLEQPTAVLEEPALSPDGEELPADVAEGEAMAEESAAEAETYAEDALGLDDENVGIDENAGLTEQERLAEEWVSRAWPALVLALIIIVIASLWLNAGQMGFVAHVIRNQQPELSAFWGSASRAFLPLLGGWGLSMLGAIGIGLAIVVVAWLFSLLSVLPTALLVVLGLVLGLAVMIGLVWLAVRLLFWFIAIVADQLGPVRALKASFKVTSGRWWQIFGLGILMVLISVGVSLVFQVLGGVGGLIGGPFGTALAFIVGVAGAAANLFVAFAALGAYVRYYEDLKSTGGATAAIR